MSKTNTLDFQISPRFVTRGGKIVIHLPFDNDPFSYHPSDFSIDSIPLRAVFITNQSFCGEVSPLLESKDHILSIHNVHTKENFELPLLMPQTVASNFYQLENSVFFDTQGNLLFLDIQKSPRDENQYIPVLCRHELETKKNSSIILPDVSINAIFVDQENRLFATSIQEKTVFIIEEDLKLTPYARGLGAPFGMISNAYQELFMADQKGSLFQIEDHRATFLTDIPPSFKGYYLAVCPQTQNIYISTPNYLGENTIMVFEYKTKKLKQKWSTYNLIGPMGFDSKQYFYWVENTREESIIYRQYGKKKPEKILSGRFFTGLSFDEHGNMYINDLHTVYKIAKEILHGK